MCITEFKAFELPSLYRVPRVPPEAILVRKSRNSTAKCDPNTIKLKKRKGVHVIWEKIIDSFLLFLIKIRSMSSSL